MGHVVLEPITRDAIARANKRGREIANASTALISAEMERIGRALHVRLVFRDGTRLSIPCKRIAEIADAKTSMLTKIAISPARDSISFPALDKDISVPGLLHDLYASDVLAQNGRLGGTRSTPAKTAAVRANGLKGGRPRSVKKTD